MCVTDMAQSPQEDIDYIAQYIDVKYEVINNLLSDEGRRMYLAKITLTNIGSSIVRHTSDWKIYFFSLRQIEPNVGAKDVETLGNLFRITHINGYLFSLSPVDNFPEIQPGESVSVTYRAASANAARSDNFPNWYVTAPNAKAKILKSTEGLDAVFVSTFDSPAKWKRSPTDLYDPLNPGQRYEQNVMQDLEHAPLPVIPTPKEYQVDMEGSTVMIDTSKWVVVADSSLETEAHYLSGMCHALRNTVRFCSCQIT